MTQYGCPICDKVFQDNWRLERHKNRKTPCAKPAKFACICGKAYQQKNSRRESGSSVEFRTALSRSGPLRRGCFILASPSALGKVDSFLTARAEAARLLPAPPPIFFCWTGQCGPDPTASSRAERKVLRSSTNVAIKGVFNRIKLPGQFCRSFGPRCPATEVRIVELSSQNVIARLPEMPQGLPIS
jgi:hypothetical protein